MAATINGAAINAIFAQPFSDGAFEAPVHNYLRALGARRPLLLLAFAPKSAGTYFRQAAIHAVNGQLVRLCHAQGGRDGTPYLPYFMACSLDNAAPATVTHLHMQALPANRNFINAFGLKPIIMIRNIADMLASYLDMLESDSAARAEGLNCQVPTDFCEKSRGEKLSFMIDVIASWYASYFATWKTFVDEYPETVCVLRYRDFCNSPAEAIHKALNHARFVVARNKVVASLERVWGDRSCFQFNKGVSGRGRDYFTPAHFGRLQKQLAYYPQLRPWIEELVGNSLNTVVGNQSNKAASGPADGP